MSHFNYFYTIGVQSTMLMMSSRRIMSALVACLAFLLTTNSAKSQLVTLNDSNFEHETQASTGSTTGSWLILFKAERCAHCKKISPEFEKLAADVELVDNGIVLGTIDVPSNRDTTVRFGVRGFPTILYIHDGQLFRYKGERTYAAIKEYLLNQDWIKSRKAGEVIPPPLSAFGIFTGSIKAILVELLSLANGEQGMAGLGITGLLLIMIILFGGLFHIFFLVPTEKGEKKLQ